MLLTFAVGNSSNAAPTKGGPVAPDGKTQVQLDVPEALRIKNRGGTDGYGLCVWASINVSASWQNETKLADLFAKMTKKRGGGWPERVDQELKPTGARYLQYRGRDLALLKLALRCGRLPAITWNGRNDPNYRGLISHMVNLVHLDETHAAILDNNHPGRLLWMTHADLLAGAAGRGSFWAVVLLDKGPPPPIPVNDLVRRSAAGDSEGGTPEGFWGPNYQWWYHPTDKDRVYLYDASNKLCGAWCYAGSYWRSWDEDQKKWLAKRPSAPFDPPALPSPRPAKYKMLGTATDYGSWLHILPARDVGEEVCELNGVRVTPAEAWMALALALSVGQAAGGKLVDDSQLLRLTVVGGETLRRQVLQDLDRDPALAVFKGKLLVQDYPADSPLVTGVRIQPGITVQTPPAADGTGKELHRQKDYSGPADLARVLDQVGAQRVPAPNFDPSKTPDLRTQTPVVPAPAPQPAPVAPQPTPDVTTPVVVGSGAGAILALLLPYVGRFLLRLLSGGGSQPTPVVPVPVPQPNPAPLDLDLGGLLDQVLKDRPILRALANRIFDRFGERVEAVVEGVLDDTAEDVAGRLAPGAIGRKAA